MVAEQLTQFETFVERLQRFRSGAFILDIERGLVLLGRFARAAAQVFLNAVQRRIDWGPALGDLHVQGTLEIDAGILERLDRVRRRNLIQEVLVVVRRLVTGAGAHARHLQV
ncbi:hypothetical protein D9M71_163710 [compost metagenome]